MVMPTMPKDIIEKWFAKMVKTIPMFKTARTEHHGGRTTEHGETYHVLVHCKDYHMEAVPRQKDRAVFHALG